MIKTFVFLLVLVQACSLNSAQQNAPKKLVKHKTSPPQAPAQQAPQAPTVPQLLLAQALTTVTTTTTVITTKTVKCVAQPHSVRVQCPWCGNISTSKYIGLINCVACQLMTLRPHAT